MECHIAKKTNYNYKQQLGCSSKVKQKETTITIPNCITPFMHSSKPDKTILCYLGIHTKVTKLFWGAGDFLT